MWQDLDRALGGGVTLFSKLRELEKKATPKEWSVYRDESGTLGLRDFELYPFINFDGGFHRLGPDADLIVGMRNTLPKIFEVLDLYEDTLNSMASWNDPSEVLIRRSIEESAAAQASRWALKRAKEIAE